MRSTFPLYFNSLVMVFLLCKPLTIFTQNFNWTATCKEEYGNLQAPFRILLLDDSNSKDINCIRFNSEGFINKGISAQM